MYQRVKRMQTFCRTIGFLCMNAALMAVFSLFTGEISYFEFWVLLLLTLLLMVLNALLLLKIETTFLQRLS